jgi:hypothetical protein
MCQQATSACLPFRRSDFPKPTAALHFPKKRAVHLRSEGVSARIPSNAEIRFKEDV